MPARALTMLAAALLVAGCQTQRVYEVGGREATTRRRRRAAGLAHT